MATAEETAITVAVLANDSDPDGGTLTVTGMVNPAHGTAVVNAGASITYTPATDYTGTDTLTYTISDGQGGTAVGTVVITVTPVNDTPVAVSDIATSGAAPTAIAVLANDTDVDGDTLTVASVTQGAHGTVAVSAGSIIVYTPAVGYTGGDVFSYTVSDGHGGTATASVIVTVTADPVVNRAPVVVSDSATLTKDTSAVIAVLANDSDPDGDALLVGATTPPLHGTVVVNANSTITYTPVAGYVGTDVFTYTAHDPAGLMATGSVTVTVTAASATPTPPEDKDLCKDGLWRLLGFKNQGQCVAAANQVNNEGDGDECNIALALALLSDRQLSGASLRSILNGQVAVLTLKPILVVQPVIVQPVVTVNQPIISGSNNNRALISFQEKAKAEEKATAALKARAEAKAKAEAFRKGSKQH